MESLLVFAALVASCYCAAVTPFTWNDCATNPNTALTIHSLSLSPNPIVFPGNLDVTMNVTINKPITALYIDVQLSKKTILGNAQIPCIGATNIGTCDNIDACGILSDVLNGTNVISADLGRQVEAILLSALGHQPQCPIQPEHLVVTQQTLTLKALPTELSTIANGNYHIKMTVKESQTATDNVGCLEFDAGIKRADDGLLFG